MTPEMNELFEEIVGQPCTRQEVGSMRGISLGFGGESIAPKRGERKYRLWEFGAYSGDWQITNNVDVVLAKRFSSNVGELDTKLKTLQLGRFVSIQQLSKSAIQMNLDNGLVVDFFGDTKNEDEYFHVFCPENVYVEFSDRGWQVGRSDIPWTGW